MKIRRNERYNAAWRVTMLLLVLILSISCGRSERHAEIYEAMGYTPVFESGECAFDVPEGYDVDCGYLTVPENRSRPDGAMISLHVAIFRSSARRSAPDPVFHLVGGPGASLLDSAAFYLGAGGEDILASRDYVLFNQRGTRYSDPYLDCPGLDQLRVDLSTQIVGHAEKQAQEIEAIMACHDDMLSQGIDLSAYNSMENAADVNDLRFALGYEQVNLYGISYGARLALTVIREYPEAVRSAIIDSGYPMQVNIGPDFGVNAARAFDLVFERCVADPACASAHPDLETTFYNVIDRLNENPVSVEINRGEVFITGHEIIDIMFGSLYTQRVEAGADAIPEMIAVVDEGQLEYLLSGFEAVFAEGHLSEGLYYSTLCREEFPEDSYEMALALTADMPPQLRDHYVTPMLSTICNAWESGTATPEEKEVVISDIPVLVLTGQFDPITPPAYNRTIAETLENSFFYEIPGIGHGAMRGSACALEIGLQFLDDPAVEPDASCLE